MITLQMTDTDLSKVLDSFETGSKLEEMLSLMIGDKRIMRMSISNNKLYGEKRVRNRVLSSLSEAVVNEAVPHWELDNFELEQFFLKLKEVISAKLKVDLSNEHSISIQLNDSRVLLVMPEGVGEFEFDCRKSPTMYTSEFADIVGTTLGGTTVHASGMGSGRAVMADFLANLLPERRVTIEDAVEIQLER